MGGILRTLLPPDSFTFVSDILAVIAGDEEQFENCSSLRVRLLEQRAGSLWALASNKAPLFIAALSQRVESLAGHNSYESSDLDLRPSLSEMLFLSTRCQAASFAGKVTARQ